MQKLFKALENEFDFDLEKDKIKILHNHSDSDVVDIQVTDQSTGEVYNIKGYSVLLGEFIGYDDNDYNVCEDVDGPMDEECIDCPNYKECLKYEH